METERLEKLIKAIVYFVNSKEGYINKTKLLKYLYLVDIEHYHTYGKTFTGFNWIFFKYGPWAGEYNEIYDKMADSGEIIVKPGNRPDLDTQFLYINEEIDLGGIFESFKEEIKIKRILERWSGESLGKMLDYVYFHTEPMENAERNKQLDFTKVKRDKSDEKFVVTKGEISAKDLEKLRDKFQKILDAKKEERHSEYTTPVYDEAFWKSIRKMDQDEEY